VLMYWFGGLELDQMSSCDLGR